MISSVRLRPCSCFEVKMYLTLPSLMCTVDTNKRQNDCLPILGLIFSGYSLLDWSFCIIPVSTMHHVPKELKNGPHPGSF